MCVYHLLLHRKWYFLHSNQCTKIPTLSWRFLNWLLAKIEFALTMCVILCVFSLQSLHSGVSLVLSIEYLMALTRRAHKKLSVSRLSSLRFSHDHLFLSSVLSVSPKKWPWEAFSFHLVRQCFLLSGLFLTYINFLSFSYVAAMMTSFSLFLRVYSAKFSISSLT